MVCTRQRARTTFVEKGALLTFVENSKSEKCFLHRIDSKPFVNFFKLSVIEQYYTRYELLLL